MQYAIEKRPSYAVLSVTLAEGEAIHSRPGAMMTRSAGIGTDSSVGGGEGVAGTVKRAVSDERHAVENTYFAQSDDERVTLVPREPGDIAAINVSETGPIRAQSGGLLAWEPLVERSTEFNDRSNLLSSGELTVLGLLGRGHAFVSSFGSTYVRRVTSDAPLVVDEDHLVAWTAGLDLTRRKDGSLGTAVLGGEGFVTEFRGNGRVWLQTRNSRAFPPASAGGDRGTGGGVGLGDFVKP